MCDVTSEITEGLLIRIQEYWKLNSLGLKETDNNNQSIIMSELIHTYIKYFFLLSSFDSALVDTPFIVSEIENF